MNQPLLIKEKSMSPDILLSLLISATMGCCVYLYARLEELEKKFKQFKEEQER